jgi:hypothetical protein
VRVSAPEPEAEDVHIIAVVVSQKELGGVVSQKIISCTTPMKPLGGVEKQRYTSLVAAWTELLACGQRERARRA